MQSKKNKSFRSMVKTANLLVIVCILIFLVVFNIINSSMLGRYNDLLLGYTSISEYYDGMEEASMHMKDYLYTESEAAMDKYEAAYKEAASKLDVLKENPYLDESWRFDLLDTMGRKYNDLCKEMADDFRSDSAAYEHTYDTIQHYYYLINNTSSEYYQMIIKAMQSQKRILLNLQFLTTASSFILILILSVWLIYYMYHIMRSLTKPLNLLLSNIQKVKEGKYDLRKISDSGQEMEELCFALDEMAMQVQRNFDNAKEKAMLERRLLETENENLRKDEQLMQSELRMLQNQINPHFLFNTLNMIHRLVVLEETDVASEMIMKTSQLLRYGLDKQNKVSNMKAELDVIRCYIDIQQLRHGNRIAFHVWVENEEELRNISIPGMILQPLVENALRHGLKDVLRDGQVTIGIQNDKDEIIISVKDNGAGIPTNKLQQLKDTAFQKDENGSHLGLYNVIRRLEMYYKDRIQIHIQSDQNKGFTFTAAIRTEVKKE